MAGGSWHARTHAHGQRGNGERKIVNKGPGGIRGLTEAIRTTTGYHRELCRVSE